MTVAVNTLNRGKWTKHRSGVAPAVEVAADVIGEGTRGKLQTDTCLSVLFGVQMTPVGGADLSTASISLDIYSLSDDGPIMIGETGDISNGEVVEVNTYSHAVWAVIAGIVGEELIESLDIIASPGAPGY